MDPDKSNGGRAPFTDLSNNNNGDYRSIEVPVTAEGETDGTNLSRSSWPSHARRPKDNEGRKKGRGPVKGHSASHKRIKFGSQKLEVQFSSRLGGSVGANYRSFVDEIVIFTRKWAPLIGVRSWKDIKLDVKKSIAQDVLDKWDLKNTEDANQKIWHIARARYAGWRSTLSATYRAYSTDAERMKHMPVDVDVAEWIYLLKYFATPTFKTKSSGGTNSRKERKNEHGGGSKSFSQHSYEQRNPETGEEPNDIDLWLTTHKKGGQWSTQASEDVYQNAVLNLRAKRVELKRDDLTHEEENMIFQSSYREIMGCKRSTSIHGHGYMAKYPTRAELMDAHINQSRATAAEKEKNKQLEVQVEKLSEQVANQKAETDRKVEEASRKIREEDDAKREELRKQLREEMAAWCAAQRATSTQMTEAPSNIQADDASMPPTVQQQITTNGSSLVTRSVNPTTHRNGMTYVSSQQLTNAVNRGRVTRSRREQEGNI